MTARRAHAAQQPSGQHACPDTCRCCVVISADAALAVTRWYIRAGLLPASVMEPPRR